jgi:aminoglycoside phosphotransferase (APT) family kinase protein
VALGYWRERVDVELVEVAEIDPHTFKEGFLSRADMLHRYAKRTGRDVSSFPFYLSWALWKNAAVVQQIYVRYVRGQTTDPRFATFATHPPALARAAARYASQLGFHD